MKAFSLLRRVCEFAMHVWMVLYLWSFFACMFECFQTFVSKMVESVLSFKRWVS